MTQAPANDSDFHRARLAAATAAKTEAIVRELKQTHEDATKLDAMTAEILAHMRGMLLAVPEECRAIPGLVDADIVVLDREMRRALDVKADIRLVGRKTSTGLALGRRR